MRLLSMRGLVLSATMLASPFFGFAAGQSKIRPMERYTGEGAMKAVQQGKGSGTMRIQAFSQGSAYRAQTALDSGVLRDAAPVVRAHTGDSAKRK